MEERTSAILAAVVNERGHHRCGPVEVTKETFDELLASIEADEAARAARMPDEYAALMQMQDAYTRLKALGWKDAIYCPKNGTIFDAIEAGSTGIHDCHYMGEWPDGGWWTHDGSDLWPSRPILFRLKSPTPPLGENS